MLSPITKLIPEPNHTESEIPTNLPHNRLAGPIWSRAGGIGGWSERESDLSRGSSNIGIGISNSSNSSSSRTCSRGRAIGREATEEGAESHRGEGDNWRREREREREENGREREERKKEGKERRRGGNCGENERRREQVLTQNLSRKSRPRSRQILRLLFADEERTRLPSAWKTILSKPRTITDRGPLAGTRDRLAARRPYTKPGKQHRSTTRTRTHEHTTPHHTTPHTQTDRHRQKTYRHRISQARYKETRQQTNKQTDKQNREEDTHTDFVRYRKSLSSHRRGGCLLRRTEKKKKKKKKKERKEKRRHGSLAHTDTHGSTRTRTPAARKRGSTARGRAREEDPCVCFFLSRRKFAAIGSRSPICHRSRSIRDRLSVRGVFPRRKGYREPARNPRDKGGPSSTEEDTSGERERERRRTQEERKRDGGKRGTQQPWTGNTFRAFVAGRRVVVRS
ncbi:uncharacterized protein LOC143363044 [Halictus rubicundus]|uniref:uncharacterized protein LOC143363044 n=1 Tax=Halictus rubicundus TaxID=77578 RepID=UPI00403758F9